MLENDKIKEILFQYNCLRRNQIVPNPVLYLIDFWYLISKLKYIKIMVKKMKHEFHVYPLYLWNRLFRRKWN